MNIEFRRGHPGAWQVPNALPKMLKVIGNTRSLFYFKSLKMGFSTVIIEGTPQIYEGTSYQKPIISPKKKKIPLLFLLLYRI